MYNLKYRDGLRPPNHKFRVAHRTSELERNVILCGSHHSILCLLPHLVGSVPFLVTRGLSLVVNRYIQRVIASPELGWEGSSSESVRASTRMYTLRQVNSGRIGSSSSSESFVTQPPPPTFDHSAVPAQAPDISNHSSTAFVPGPVSATPSFREKNHHYHTTIGFTSPKD
jgi:hypothetical protein